MMPPPTPPARWCVEGRHFYLALFNACPRHRGRLWNVRVKTRYANFRKPDGMRTKEWTFQQMAQTPKAAGRAVLESVFGDRRIQELFVVNVEIWAAERIGVPQADIWKGTAS